MELLLDPIFLAGIMLVFWCDICTAPFSKESFPPINRSRNTVDDFVSEQLAKGVKSNRLIDQKSPYLLQHAFNPVSWFPWGEEAFRKAASENKPVFLSIGYSTCHWCHVMAHESFEDEKIASYLNRHFINIKVDREERPDLDQLYMAVTQSLSGGGGWPMSLFLTPSRKPFFAGTYFAPKARYGRPGFLELLESIQQSWHKNAEAVVGKAEEFQTIIAKYIQEHEPAAGLNSSILGKAAASFAQIYDRKNAGFGMAPKFPRPAALSFLLWHSHVEGNETSMKMVLKTLDNMAKGGMCDHLGGGFHRYSVDEIWHVPHFEKMLYDQALLVTAYCEAYQISAQQELARVARETLAYILRDMQGEDGGFCCAEDADSPYPHNPERSGEGAFYTWQAKEVRRVLGGESAAIFMKKFSVEDEGNVAIDPLTEFHGLNILHIRQTDTSIAKEIGKYPEEVSDILKAAMQRLREVRESRPRPHLDDKILVSWNALMISALAKGYQVFGDDKYLQAAEATANFIMDTMFDAEREVLLRRYRDGNSDIEGVLEDYAFLIQSFLDLYEASFNWKWLIEALNLSRLQVVYFADGEHGGFFDTTGADDTLFLRMKSSYDAAEPTGNSVAALNFLRMGQIFSNENFTEQGLNTINSFAGKISESPVGLPQMLIAFAYHLAPTVRLVIAGGKNDKTTEDMLGVLHQRYLPNKVVMLVQDDVPDEIVAVMPMLGTMPMMDSKPTAYVCKGEVCHQPTTDIEKLKELLFGEIKEMSD